MNLKFSAVYTRGSGFPDYTLNDIQTVSFRKGRQRLTDSYEPGTLTITCRNISAWPATPKQGWQISVGALDTDLGIGGYNIFSGYISDIKINYGLKSSLDEAIITATGPIRNLGRQNLRNETLTQSGASAYINQINNIVYDTFFLRVAGSPESTLSAQTYTGNALDLVNTVLQTEVGRMYEYYYSPSYLPGVAYYGRNVVQNRPAPTFGTTYTFSDTAGSNQNQMEYDGLEFESSSDNYFTKVRTNPAGLASQVESTGTAPFVELDVDTLDATTTQADSLARYLLNTFSSTDSQLTAVSCTYRQQGKKASFAEYKQQNFLNVLEIYGPTAINVIFRGTTYYGVFEGIELSADPSDARITVYVSARDLNSYLRWDSPSPYNTWDSNKWGF